MRFARSHGLWFGACLAAAFSAYAQQPPTQPPAQPRQATQPSQLAPTPEPFAPLREGSLPAHPTVPLQPLLDRVARDSKKEFLVDRRVATEIFLGGVEQGDVAYPVLLSILRANGLAAVDIEGKVNIVPAYDVRSYATPIVPNDDNRIAADEWVTRILVTTNVDAPFLVPILRPLLPQEAHLAAMAPNRLIIMDRYANVKRITAIVKSLDQPGVGRPRDQ
jgi:type II secretory pathway component GspD/PulD (secretin)